MAEQGRNQPPTKPQFLQPVVSDLASNFSIPADFVKYLEGERCQEVQLRTRKRRQPWVVRIEGRRMMDGWDEFVKENELFVGEFLVFKYEGSLLFDVTVFSPTACKREYPPTFNNDDDGMLVDDCVTLKSNINVGISRRRSYGSSRIGNDCYVGTMGRSYMKSLYFPIGFILDNQLKEATSGILIQDEKGETWPVELCFKKDSNVVHTRKCDWIPFVKELGLREGDDFEVRIISKGVKPVLTIRRLSGTNNGQSSYHKNGQNDGGVLENDGVTLESKANWGICRRRSYGWSRIGNDCYVGTMWRSYMERLYFPIYFILDNHLKEATSGILIQDEKGGTWPVELGFKKKRNMVYTQKRGWIPFVKEIGLRDGDDFEVRVISKGAKPVLAIRRLTSKENGQTSDQNGQNDNELFEPEIEVVSETAKRRKVGDGPAQAGKIVSKPVNKKLVKELPEPEIQSTVTETLPERKTATKDNKDRVNRCEQTSHSTSADSSTRFSQTSTWPSIERSRLVVNKDFMMSNGLISKCGHIILKNLEGESWPARLRREDKKTYVCYYIGSGWRDFALSNGLGVGCQFKMEIEQPESEVLTFKLCERTPGNLNIEEDA